MAKLIRYVASFRGIKVIRSSRAVDEMLERKAHRVAAVAQGAYDADPPRTGRVFVEVLQVDSDSDRARVAVIARHPTAIAIEADRRILGSSLGAARS